MYFLHRMASSQQHVVMLHYVHVISIFIHPYCACILLAYNADTP